MQTESSIVASEIDAIIARAMAEYSGVGSVDPFVPQPVEEPEEEPESSEPDVIPSNSESVLVSEATSRFSSAIWFDNIKTKTITLAGLGGIGSYVAFLLARMQPARLFIYDDDIVEAVNMSGQLYSVQTIGAQKVYATADNLANFANYYDVNTFPDRFTNTSTASNIMICGFDNMEARKTFFDAWLGHVNSLLESDKAKCLFIDGRLAAENFQVLCLRGDDAFNIARYQKEFLFSDDEADETVCSYKQTTFMANMIGSIIVNLFVNFCANECDPLVPRDLPFLTEYTAETMYFKVTS